MNPPRLQVGIDFSLKKADVCLLSGEGRVLTMHRSFSNATSGYQQMQQLILATVEQYHMSGIDIAGEATGNYWLPFYLHLANDAELGGHDLRLYLLNPLWVHWYKKSLPQDDKTDSKDPYYIADRIRTHPPAVPWQSDLSWLALRAYTRLRFHLVQQLSSQKNYFESLLFVRYSSYAATRPFSDLFGKTSQQVLSYPPDLQTLLQQTPEEVCQLLLDWSHGALPDPQETLHKLRQVATESFPIDPSLSAALAPCLALLFKNIRFLEDQLRQVEAWMTDEAAKHPEVAILEAIPGIGPILASGISAEIGSLDRFFAPPKWDKHHQAYRNRTLRDAEDAVAKFAGLWWPRAASGDFEAEERHLSKRGNRYLRYYLVEAADHLRRVIPSYQRFYQTKFRQTGKHKHKRAIVLTARKFVGLLVGLLHRQEAYIPEKEVIAA
jgi:transposase